MEDKGTLEFTTKSYWKEYYKSSPVKRNVIEVVCGKYDYFWKKLVESCTSSPKTVLEVGAFPGRYLAYLASKYSLFPTGVDFNDESDKVHEAMTVMGISNYEYVCKDFFEYRPEQKFDLVYSNGFIEHFGNFDLVLDKHVEYLNSGGAIMIMIPNKCYLRKVYGYLCDYDNLKAHNLDCMNLGVFRRFAKRNGLKVEHLSYHGGFSFKVHQPLNFFQKVIYHVVRLCSIKLHPILSRYPSKFYSSSIIAIFSCPLLDRPNS